MFRRFNALTLIALALISFWVITAGQSVLAGEMVIKESQEQGRQEMLSSAAVLAALESFNLSQDEIIVVQPIWVTLDDGQFEYWEIVITESGDYWYNLNKNLVSNSTPASVLGAHQGYLTGATCENIWRHPHVVFYLPTCFWEYTYGRFDGIVDAWASSCDWGIKAWNGRGYEEWYNYLTCSNNPRMSSKVGKVVNTTWFWYNYTGCDFWSLTRVASRVTALVTW